MITDADALAQIRDHLDTFFRGGNPYEALGLIAQITGLNTGAK